VTGTCFNPAIVRDSLGPVESLPGCVAIAEDNENTAWDFQGWIFYDDDLGHCIVTGWGVDHGTNIVFYTPCWSKNSASDACSSCTAGSLSWVRDSPVSPRITDYRSSRALKMSNKTKDVETLMMRTVVWKNNNYYSKL
jgi:hypothetical protein